MVEKKKGTSSDIPADYYLTNFQSLLEFVAHQYSDLLNSEERQFLSSFAALDEDAKKLYVRLITRKGPLFRSDKLKYSEINNLPQAAIQLEASGFLQINEPVTLEEFVDLLTKRELIHWFAAVPGIKTTMKKKELFNTLLMADPEVPEVSFDLYQPNYAEIIVRLKFLFFGNLYQDLTEFVLQDLGLTKFEGYSLAKENRLFNSQADLEYGIRLSELSLQAAEAEYDKDSDALIALAEHIPETPSHPVLYRKFCRLVNRVAREQERAGLYQNSLDTFKHSALPPSRERQIRILEKLGRTQESLQLCGVMIENPASDMEKDISLRFAKKIKGEKNQRIKQPFNDVYLQLKNRGGRVEKQVQTHYQELGWQAYYVENLLINSIAGLYFWDIIFADIPGAFFHPFQNAPADLMTPDFYQKRQRLINDRLMRLTESHLKHVVMDTYRQKEGVANRLVDWSGIDPTLLELACEMVPVDHFRVLFSRLMFDLAHNRTGFPDLILFKPEMGAYCWVEVKGPGDKLQDNQKRWLNLFNEQQIPYEVAYVEWAVT